MERYDRIIQDVIERTEGESLAWKLIPRNTCAGAVLNVDQILRAYRASDQRKTRGFFHDSGFQLS